MLARLDRILAPLTWLAAAALVLMLFVGPQIVAEDKAESAGGKEAGVAPYAGGSSGSTAATPSTLAEGERVFADRCGSCHTLSAANTSGTTGPALDGAGLDAATVESAIREGPGVMPSFAGQLSDAQIGAVAAFVAQASAG
jgi:sulfite dehydrogenase